MDYKFRHLKEAINEHEIEKLKADIRFWQGMWFCTILLTFLLLASGCGPQEFAEAGPDGWDDDLRTIALDFAADAAEFGLPLGKLGRIHVIKTDPERVAAANNEDTLGYCRTWSGRHGRVFRGEIYVVELEDQDKLRRLMYHELTHCVYDQGHWGSEYDIQYPTLSTEIPWEEARERHFTQLKLRL